MPTVALGFFWAAAGTSSVCRDWLQVLNEATGGDAGARDTRRRVRM